MRPKFPLLYKLLLSFASLSLFIVVVGYFGVRSIEVINKRFQRTQESVLPALEATSRLIDSWYRVIVIAQQFTFLKDSSYHEELTAAVKTLTEDIEAYNAVAVTREELTLGKRLQTTASVLEENIHELFPRIERPELFEDPVEQRITAKRIKAVVQSRDAITNLLTAREFAVASISGLAKVLQDEAARARQLTLALLGGSIAVSLILAFFLSYFLVRPIRELTGTVQDISGGNLARRVRVVSHDEIGMLAAAFNAMTERLAASYGELEKKAAELEKNLGETRRLNVSLEDAKRAMLNLLEDAKSAEEQERIRAEELRKAIEQVSNFASLADQQRNLYLLLLSSIGEGVVVVEPDLQKLTIRIVNRAAEQILGYTETELVGTALLEKVTFITEDKRTLMEQGVWAQVLKQRTPFVISSGLSVVSRNGTIPITAVLSPIFDKKTETNRGVIVTMRDVREERALDEARISFISTASHQLRTPLTSMRWFSEMLLAGDAGKINEEQEHFVERIYQGTDRMIALVNLLLQIARVEAGRVKIEPVPVDLKTTTQGVALTLKAGLEAKKQQLSVTTNPITLPTIQLDQDVIWQVVQNLLSNANRYSPEGSTIFVSIEDAGDTYRYSVQDSGIGIPPDQRDRIFEKFFRADNALQAVPEGSGLGLSLVKTLVEGWGGKIWFESEVGKGTTFFFTIPKTGMKAKAGEVKLAV